MGTTYSPHVDGLRALAVLAVIFFHADLAGFAGGFVGVDIFFVISGYLMARISAGKAQGTWSSIFSFYSKRLRRILPALIAMGIVCLLIAWRLYPPQDFAHFGNSLKATFLFYSNIQFWLDTAYFSNEAEISPLLHTWSLGVEGQFYLLFPLALALLQKWPQHLKTPLLFSGIAASLAFSIWTASHHPGAAFYLLPSRIWEFLIGVALASPWLRRIHNPAANNALVFAGLALIAFSVATYSGMTDFPGIAATVPCLGAALIIYAGERCNGIASTIMTSRIPVFLGLVSYSLYLWHWPMLAFYKAVFGPDLEGVYLLAYLAAVLGMSVASWKLIEIPFRRKGILVPLNTSWSGAAALLLLVAAGSHIGKTHGLPERFDSELLRVYSEANDWSDEQRDCTSYSPEELNADKLCTIGNPDTDTVSFILWGDSHAQALYPAFDAVARKHGVKGYYASVHACPPLYGVDFVRSGKSESCAHSYAAIEELVDRSDIRSVFLVARWAVYLHGFPQGENPTQPARLVADPAYDIGSTGSLLNTSTKLFRDALGQTLDRLAPPGRSVFIYEQVPLQSFYAPRRVFISRVLGMPMGHLGIPIDEHLTRQASAREIFKELGSEFEFTVVDPALVLCDEELCRASERGRTLYRDDDHLSAAGSMLLTDLIEPAFGQHFAQSAGTALNN